MISKAPRSIWKKAGPKRLITDAQILDECRDQIAEGRKNVNAAEIARKYNVNPETVRKRLKQIKKRGSALLGAIDHKGTHDEAIVPVPMGNAIGENPHDHEIKKWLNCGDQLQKINDNSNWLMDQLMAWCKGDETALQVLESQMHKKKIKVGKETKTVEEARFKDPRDLLVKIFAELRGQIHTQMEMAKMLYSAEAIKEFQEEVIDAINEVSPETRNRIVNRLLQKQSITRSSYRNWLSG